MLITEVMAQPETSQLEWVELLNPDDSPALVTGFVLKDHLASPSVLYTFDAQSVGAGEYIVIEIAGSKLNNAGDGVTLLADTGFALDEMTFSSSQKGVSWQKYAGGWCESIPTPGGPHNCPEPTPTPSVSPTPSPTTAPLPSSTPTPTSSPSPSSKSSASLKIETTPDPGASDTSLESDATLESAAQSALIQEKLQSLQKLFIPPVIWNIPQAEPLPPATDSPQVTDSPAINLASTQDERLLPSRVVIMGGLLIVMSIFVPSYDQIKSHTARLVKRFASASSLGSLHLHTQRPVQPPKPR